MNVYKLRIGKLGKTIVKGYKGIEKRFTDAFLEADGSLKTGNMGRKAVAAYRTIEDAVVGGYRKVEDTVVGGYKKIEATFINAFLDSVYENEAAFQAECALPADGNENA